MSERSRHVKKATSPRRANEDFLHPSHGSTSSYHSSRRGSDATLSESIGSLDDDDEDAPGESEDEDEDQAEVDLSTMTPAERLAYKRRLKRFRLNHNQTRFLLSEFARQQHPDAAHRARLAKEIPGLSPRQVQIWFQNRRAKLKRLPSDEQSQVVGSRALPPEYMAAQTQSFRRIEPTHPQNAYTSSLSLDPSTLKPPSAPSVSLTPPNTYTHSPISAYGSSTHASPITPEQADDFWSTPYPYAGPSLISPADMLSPQQPGGGYPPPTASASSLLSYAPSTSDFSRSRSASLTAAPPGPLISPYESSSYTTSQQREYYSSSSSAAHRGGLPSQWPPHPQPQQLRRPSAQYLSSLTHSQPQPPGIRVDETGYRRARANSGDSLFVTTMEELRLNPTVQAGAGLGGTQGGFEEVGGYENEYFGDPAQQQGTGRGDGGRGRRMG